MPARHAQAIGPATGGLVGESLKPYTLTRLREVQALLRLPELYMEERASGCALESGDGRYRTV